MKSVLISINPKWCEKIASGEKTIEVRKTRPMAERPFKCYIYCTKSKNKNGDLWSDPRVKKVIVNGEEHWDYVEDSLYYMNGKVIGEFLCYGIMRPSSYSLMSKYSCLTIDELNEYSNGKYLFGWRIEDLKIYDKPKELREFGRLCPTKEKRGDYVMKRLTRPPQNWCYVEEINNDKLFDSKK